VQSCELAKDKNREITAPSQGVIWQYPVPGCRVAGKILIEISARTEKFPRW